MSNPASPIAGKKEILLVEDDTEFRKLIADNLTRNNFSVKEAENGLVAQNILSAEPGKYHMIISDVRMPEVDGVALLQHVRRTSQIPFIVMTGFSEVLQPQSAFGFGASAFLPKPLRTEVLLSAIQKCLEPAGAVKPDPVVPFKPEDFRQIHLDDFNSSSILPSDVYVGLSKDHYVKIAKKGEAVSKDRLTIYRSRKVTHLYVKAEDFKLYADAAFDLAREIVLSKTVPREKKVEVMRQAAEALTQVCFLDSIDKDLVAKTTTLISQTVELACEDSNVLHLLTNISTEGNPLYAHSVSVSIFASLIGRKFGWTSPQSHFKISTCGLLHDIGKRELPAALFAKKRAWLTPEEIMQIETHPVRGREILLQITGIPEEVGQGVFEHHEKYDGTGYPRQIKGELIHPMGRLVHLADRFVGYVMPMAEGLQRLSPEEALVKLATLHADEVDKKFLLCLADVFGLRDKVQEHLNNRAKLAAS